VVVTILRASGVLPSLSSRYHKVTHIQQYLSSFYTSSIGPLDPYTSWCY
jgi:hypothetical protein